VYFAATLNCVVATQAFVDATMSLFAAMKPIVAATFRFLVATQGFVPR